MQNSTFKKGYQEFISTETMGSIMGTHRIDSWLDETANACNEFEANINAFKGFETDARMLKGDVFEFYKSGTFNINAAINNSKYHTSVDRSHNYASADILSNWNEKFGLKVCYNGMASAKAQAISHYQKFIEYKSISGRTDLTFADFISERCISPNDILSTDSIYKAQTRIVTVDQIDDGKSWLLNNIAKKKITDPDEVARFQETLDNTKTCIEAPDGTKSTPVTTGKLMEITEKAKKGEYSALKDGLTPEQLIKFEQIISQGVKAGITAATISLILKTAPGVYRCLDELISLGYISEKELKEVGFAALDGTIDGFLRGFVAAIITASCELGIWGDTLKGVSPEIVGALTVVMLNTLKDSFLLVKGNISNAEFSYNLQRNIFITACGIGGGAVLQTILPMVPFAYLLGNFVGAMIGSFAFVASDNAVLSFCIYSGSTFFKIVDQNYQLPERVLKELGVSFFEYEHTDIHKYAFDEFPINEYNYKEYSSNISYTLKRGIIGIRQIGFV